MHEPTIFASDVHRINQNLIDKDALYVIEKLQSHGYTSYLVGGSVRDLMTNRQPKDYDVSTSAKPEEIKRLFGRSCILIGRRFRLAHIRFGKKAIEVSTFRAQESQQGELVIEDNLWGSPEEDAARRDFTLNGLFFEPRQNIVIDYVGGIEDLSKGVLRTIGKPHARFREDPVRMIRLLKFHARLGFEIEEETKRALYDLRHEIIKSSQARILEEFLRMLESGKSASFFELMKEHHFLDLLFPSLSSWLSSPIGNNIYKLLHVNDRIQSHFGPEALERPVLLAAFTFPYLEEQLKQHKDKEPHLGDIMMASHNAMHALIHGSFMNFPKKLTATTTSIMMNQYRLTQTHHSQSALQRAIRLKDFPLVLKFLRVRSLADPNLIACYQHWKNLYRTSSHHGDRTPHPRHYTSPRRR